MSILRPLLLVASAVAGAAALVACGAGERPGVTVESRGPDGGTADGAGPHVSDDAGFDPDADAEAAGDAEAGSEEPPSVCPPNITVGAGTALPMSTPGDDIGLSVTPDELSAAWVTRAGAVVTIHYADRADKGAAFGTPRTTTGPFAPGRVALTPDGLGLAVSNEDELGFSLLTRSARTEAFGAPEPGPFELLNAQGIEELADGGERYADPLFASGGSYFVFSRYAPTSTSTVYLASRIFASDPFSPGTPLAEAAVLAPVGGKRRIVTGASDDVRTLFVWDESIQKSRFVSLGTTGEVVGSGDVGAMRDLQASADCKTFYFTAGAPADLFRFAAP